ncbi:YkuS family protein [Clostridium oceanicum]|uniref:YkuS family protein n=1 Tax=Clostridium oceanicum TaxID=1543 RepID=A0ABN1JS69_9CLOT
MHIFVSNNLQYIKNELEKRGYNISINYDKPYDAIICDLKEEGTLNLFYKNNINAKGALIIDSSGKNIEEIEDILNYRSFTPLF